MHLQSIFPGNEVDYTYLVLLSCLFFLQSIFYRKQVSINSTVYFLQIIYFVKAINEIFFFNSMYVCAGLGMCYIRHRPVALDWHFSLY